ncbi:MAG: hypothetical protein R2939_16285 [Kofleriaceae bacterium]
MTSTFPCLASSIGLSEGSCGTEVLLVVSNTCSEVVTLPGPLGELEVAVDDTVEIDVSRFEDGCSYTIPVSVGDQLGTISFRFE